MTRRTIQPIAIAIAATMLITVLGYSLWRHASGGSADNLKGSVPGATTMPSASKPAEFPTKPGAYSLGGWRYDYTITAPGSRSERRFGRLYFEGAEIIGSLGEIRDTPLGRFAFFGTSAVRYSVGWLNTLAYEQPAFGSDGKLLPEVETYFSDLARPVSP